MADKLRTNEREGLKEAVQTSSPEASDARVDKADKASAITYSLITGGILDYASGLSLGGIVASRAYAGGINYLTGGEYGLWQERMYRWTNTTEKSGKLRKGLVDLLAFNTLQVPIYATAVTVASLVSEGKVDFEKVEHGARNLALISPFIAPTMRISMNWFRKLFRVKSIAERAHTK
jgi:hypothetical protein